MKTSNNVLPSADTTITSTFCDVNTNESESEQYIAVDSTTTSDDHDIDHSTATTTSTYHFSETTATSSEQQQQQSSRPYRSSSLIRIELDNEDDDSSISNSSNDSNVDVNRSTPNPTTRRLVNSDHSYPHSDTECSSAPVISDGINSDKKLTVLLPFNNQVGGHTQLMLLDQSTLCKPLVQRELLFYLNIPRELQEYVPNYKGVVEVRYCENNFPTLYHPHKRMASSSSTSSSLAVPESWKKPELRVQLCSCNDRRLLQQCDLNSSSNSGPHQSSSARSELSNTVCYSSRPSQRYFMLLENITSNYHLPCVLDLKMGIRQHGEDASDEKRNRQMAKCAATTSASLGVRICGMQTYHKVADNNYRLYQVDKYYGRRIKNESGLQNELEIYFKNRPYLIGPVVKRLKELKSQVLATLRKKALRFYSTSLLIVSEGCSTAHRSRPIFKHHNSDGEEEEEEDEEEYFHDDLDSEFENSDEEFHDDEEDEVLEDSDESNDSTTSEANVVLAIDDEEDSSADSSDVHPKAIQTSTTSSSSIESRYVPSKHYVCTRDHRRRSLSALKTTAPTSEFDVRMIDFAHTCFSSGSSTDGFTVGLENLIRLLNNIRGRGQLNSKSAQSESSEQAPSSASIINGKKRRRSSGHDLHGSGQHFRNHHHHQQHFSSRTLKKDFSSSELPLQGHQTLSSIIAGTPEQASFLHSEDAVMEPPANKSTHAANLQ